MEQHIVLLSVPGSLYIGHKIPDSKSSVIIIRDIINFVIQKEIILLELVVNECDETNANFVKKNSSVRRREIFVGYRFTLVCVLKT